jgi:MFS family permease
MSTLGHLDRSPVRGDSLGYWAFIIGVGFLATHLSQPEVIDLPLRYLLERDIHLTPKEMSVFFALATLPWYFKVLAGLLSDSIPLMGTRRRHYLILSSTFAFLFWVLVGQLPRSFYPLLFGIMAVSAMLMVGSTVTGALLVDAGQRLEAAGRLVSVRMVVTSAGSLIAGPLAAFLSRYPFDIAATASGGIAFILMPVALLWLREPTVERREPILAGAAHELKLLFGSNALWLVALFLILLNIPRTFTTALFYHMDKDLKFTPDFIGYLKALSAAGGLVATPIYAWLCLRLPLRPLLALGIVCSAIANLAFIFFDSADRATIIRLMDGFLYMLTTLACMELAVWATPKRALAMGFAILMSTWNAGQSVGDYLSTVIMEDWSIDFYGLVKINAVLMAAMLLALPFLPSKLFMHRDG